jgi:hypothetical protein
MDGPLKNAEKKLKLSTTHMECLKKKCTDKEYVNYITAYEKMNVLGLETLNMLKTAKEVTQPIINNMQQLIKLQKELKPNKKLMKCVVDQCIDTRFELEKMRHESEIARAEMSLRVLMLSTKPKKEDADKKPKNKK